MMPYLAALLLIVAAFVHAGPLAGVIAILLFVNAYNAGAAMMERRILRLWEEADDARTD